MHNRRQNCVRWPNQAYIDHRDPFMHQPPQGFGHGIDGTAGRLSAVHIVGKELGAGRRAVKLCRAPHHQGCDSCSMRLGESHVAAAVAMNRHPAENRMSAVDPAVNQTQSDLRGSWYISGSNGFRYRARISILRCGTALAISMVEIE